jgi:predicted enzyme related to lactoylglutathione lyase
MNIKGVDFIFYNVTDFKRSFIFYRDILGLKATQEKEGWAEFDVGNITLAIGNFDAVNDGGKAKNNVSAAFAVDDVIKAVEYLKKKGVRVVQETMDFPGCGMAIALDPDGNEVVLHHRKDGTVG